MCEPTSWAAFGSWLAGTTGTTAAAAAGGATAAAAAGTAAASTAVAATVVEGLAGVGAATTGAAAATGSVAATAAAKASLVGGLVKTAGAAGVSALASKALAPKMPTPTAPPGVATIDSDVARARAYARTRETVFGGRRGTLLTSSNGSPAVFNTGRKKLLGQ